MTQDDQQTPAPETTTYTQADLAEQAANFDIRSYDVAGIFRQAGKTELTESEFLRELAIWKGEKQ